MIYNHTKMTQTNIKRSKVGMEVNKYVHEH